MTTTATAAADEPRRLLLATAVSRYTKCPQWDRPGLDEARERVIGLFTEQLGYRHQSALGLNPTRVQLTDQLRAFCTSADRREDDLVAMYFSGHGEVLDDGGDHVLFAADTDPDDITYTALPTVELARVMLRKTRIRRLLLVLDTCYSGQGGNEVAAAALERISGQWGQSADGSGLVIVSSAQPHQQATAGLFPHLLDEAVGSLATAGHRPRNLSVSAVVQQINDHPARPAFQRIGLSLVGLTGEPPPFLANPRHSTRLTVVDLAVQQAAEFDAHAQRRDAELTTRLLVRAMGYPGDAAQGWWFCGRHTALADVTAWLRDPALSGSSVCKVVTAGPGSGKTAVLGLIAALTHPERRRTVPLDALGLDAEIPPMGAVDVAVYAQNLTDADVLQGLAAARRLRAGTVGELLEALDASATARPFTVLVDALDEAATPDTLCSQILRPLIDHSGGRIRLLLGTRPHLLPRLGLDARRPAHQEQIIDLDSPRYADPEALLAYTVRTLLQARPASPYGRHAQALRPVADAVATAAGTSFLVARITAGTLAATDHVPDPSDPVWRTSLPRMPGQAMRDDLARRLGPDARRATDLLRPLAFAQGQGLPWEDIWAPLASAVSGRPYTDDDLLWLRHAAGSYVVEATEHDRSAYRLYHQALAEQLREGVDERAVHAAFTTVLTDRVSYRPDGSRDWARAHPYTLHHLAAHATAAGRLDEVLGESDYLVHAAPRGLSPHLHRARTETGRLAAAVYRTVLGVHETAASEVRRQALALGAARAGARSLHRRLTHYMPEGAWAPRWATGSAFASPLRDTLNGHIFAVRAVACTTLEGRPIAVTSGVDRTPLVWDLASGGRVGKPLPGHSADVLAMACTVLDGTPVAVTGDRDGKVLVWDLASHRLLGELAVHTRRVHTVACTVVAGTPIALIGGRGGVEVWDLRSRRFLGELAGSSASEVSTVACAVLDGTPVAVTGGDDRTVRVWDLTSRRPLGAPLTGHTEPVTAVACTVLNGTPVAVTGGFDRTVRVWDLACHRLLKEMTGHTAWVQSVACAVLDGTPVAVTGSRDRTVQVWDLTTGHPAGKPLTGHTNAVAAVACTVLDGVPVAVTGGDDLMVRVWDLRLAFGHSLGEPAPGHTHTVDAVGSMVLDGTPVAVSGDDSTVRVWDLASGRPVGTPLTIGTNGLGSMACAVLDGTPIVATAAWDSVRVWNLATGRPSEMPITGGGALRSVACTVLDGRPVAAVSTGRDGTVRIWDLASHRSIGTPFTYRSADVHAVAFTMLDSVPIVAVCSSLSRVVRVWNLITGRSLGELTGHTEGVTAVACTVLDGAPVAVTGGDDRTVRVWDLTRRRPVGKPLTGHTNAVTAVACTVLDGTPIAATCSKFDHTVRLWNVRTGEPAGALAAPTPHAVAFSDAGDLIVGMGHDVAVFHQHEVCTARTPYDECRDR